MYQIYRTVTSLRNRWMRCLLILISLVCCFELSACKKQPVYGQIKPRITPEMALAAQRQHDVQTLLNQHIMVITLGETKRIIIPSDTIFSPYSANLFGNQCDKLDTVARLIASYDTVMVRVDAYEDNFFPSVISDALTNKQAQIVADYLRKHKMDTRFVLRQGNGTQNPVAGNQTMAGRCYNRRIEITFRVYPPEPMY